MLVVVEVENQLLVWTAAGWKRRQGAPLRSVLDQSLNVTHTVVDGDD